MNQPEFPDIRLPSTDAIGTPGLCAMIRSVWRTQPSVATDMLTAAFPSLPAWCIPHILAGKYAVEDGAVLLHRDDCEVRTPLTNAEDREAKAHEAEEREDYCAQ